MNKFLSDTAIYLTNNYQKYIEKVDEDAKRYGEKIAEDLVRYLKSKR